MGFSTPNSALARDIVSDRVAPPFLQGPNGSAWLTSMGQAMDVIRYRSAQAMLASMPGQSDPSALPYLGADYLLVQGPGETSAQFAARNTAAYDFWQHAGTDWALLQQALSQVLPATPAAFVVSNSARWSYYAANANTGRPPTEFFADTTVSWNWDGNFNVLGENGYWWRVWLGIYSVAPNAWATQWATLGSGGLPALGSVGAAAGSLGFSNVTSAFWDSLRAVLNTCKAAQAWIRYILVSFSSSLFSPDGWTTPAAGAVNPQGNWTTGYQIVGGAYQAVWDTNSAPVPGVPAAPGGTVGPSILNSSAGYKIVGGQYLPA